MFGRLVGNRVSLFLRKVVGDHTCLTNPRIISTAFMCRRYYRDDERYKSSYSSDLEQYFPSPTNKLRRCKKYDSSKSLSEIHVTYPPGMRDCVRIVKGERLEEDVVSLLSNGGKRDYLVRTNGDKVAVDNLVGKYLLICCFKVPLPTKGRAANACRSMIAAYSQLVKDRNFEMVMVAKMAGAPLIVAEEEESAFNRFFDAFPCLAIPFWDSESRDFVCKSLGLTHPGTHFAALVLDPDQMVLQTDEERPYNFGKKFYDYGVAGFPYSDAQLRRVAGEDEEIRCRLDYFHRHSFRSEPMPWLSREPVSLVDILGGSDFLLSRFGGCDEISLSELSKKKCVLLYLCVDGQCMYQLEGTRKYHVAKNREFEIVLVHTPFLSDTTSYVNAVQAAMEKHELSSWWVMPVKEDDWEATRRVWRLCALSGTLPWRDEWMFVADGGICGEIRGRDFMNNLSGETEMYPYSRKVMLDEVLRRMRSITLDSLLGTHNQLIHVSSDGSKAVINVCELKGKKVVIYFDYYDAIIQGEQPFPYHRAMLDSYEQIQKDHPDSRVVFVPLDEKLPEHAPCPPMPWLVLPHPAAVAQLPVIDEIFPQNGKQPGVFAFGDDGCIRSMYALEQLDEGNLFADTLHKEIFDSLMSYHLDYW